MRSSYWTKAEKEAIKKREKFLDYLKAKKIKYLFYLMERLYYVVSPSLNYYSKDDEGLWEAHAEIKNTSWLDINERITLHKKLLQKSAIIIDKKGQIKLFDISKYIKTKQRLRG